MSKPYTRWIVVLVASCLAAFTAQAQHPKTVEVETAAETDTLSVVLPSGPGSSMIVSSPPLPPLSLRASASTIYRLRNQQVTLEEFRKAIAGKQANMIVVYHTRTRALLRVKASIDPPPVSPQPSRRR